MKYCPQCRSEYREGFQTCSDCGSPLVGNLPEISADAIPEGELASVFDPPDQMIGQALAALLEDNGIRCILKSEQIPMYNGVAMMLQSRWGQLMVLEGDRARAEDLIKEYLSAPAQEGPEWEK
ncbi:MAG: DUF2007 domain-containing protein [bacterium]|nr:DUF2007 domain-containing protein [bacterium]